MNTYSRRHVLQTGMLLSLPAFGLMGCKPQPETEQLTLAHGYQPAFGLVYIAMAEGHFREEGLDVVLQRHNTGRDALQAVMDGKADVGTPFDTPVVMAILQQKPVRMLSSLGVLSDYDVVLARKDRGINTPADLKGRHVAFIPNSSNEYMLSQVLTSAGLTMRDLQAQPMQPPEAAQALLAGDVDAAGIWPPHSHQVMSQLGVHVFNSPAYVETVTLTTTEDLLQRRRPAFEKLLKALLRAEAFTLSQPDRALQHVQAALAEFSPEVVAKSWPLVIPQVRMTHQILTSLSNQAKWFALQQGLPMAQTLNVRPYLAEAPLRSIRPQAVILPDAN